MGTGFKVLVQYAVPQHLLSRLMHRATQVKTRWFKDLAIRQVVQRFTVELGDAQVENPKAYPSFNAFFTRALKPGARPLADSLVVSPADGRISAIGSIEDGQLLQAKGRHYSLSQLVGGDHGVEAQFMGGSFATVYLSPRDYHRVHMPVAGTLERMIYVPGKLFSVNQMTSENIDSLFARNERVISLFKTEIGPVAVILVGAIFVGSMETTWAGKITPPYRSAVVESTYTDTPVQFEKGAEMGRFNMGSTVIVLLPPGVVRPSKSVADPIRMGEALFESMG